MYGKRYLASLMKQETGVQQFLKLNANPEWFVGTDGEVFQLVSDHVTQFGAFPKQEALGAIELPTVDEEPLYYLDKLRTQAHHGVLAEGLNAAAVLLNNQDPKGAQTALQEAVLHGMRTDSANRIMDYANEGHDFIFQNIAAIKSGAIHRIPLGWGSLDEMTGGLGGGDVLSIVGRPANGKTFLLLWAALFGWELKNIPLVFSMEMSHLAISERLASMQTDVFVTQIKKGILPTFPVDKYTDLKETLKGNQGKPPFWLVDGAMSATIEDVIMYANHLRPSVVLIDGAYLLRTKENIPRWERNTSNLERLKGDVAEALGIPVIISYQLNRNASKKSKKGEEADLEDIGYTDAVGQISSVVLGMLEEDNPSTHNRRQVRVLKGRDGQTGDFYINWKFQPQHGLDFSEVAEKEEPEDLNESTL